MTKFYEYNLSPLRLATIVAIIFVAVSCSPDQPEKSNGIQPYSENPYYWQYHEDPVMLLGGSKDDNLFQISNLKEHLDLMKKVGANYIRNTMSSRDEGHLQAFKKLANGKYDLDQWNEEYWNRFEELLTLTAERGIFVQVELWDQWDHNEDKWNSDPWNPTKNVNYRTSDSELKGNNHYAKVLHDTDKQHDLFLTVPKVHNDSTVLSYQKKFIDKILSISFKYDHVLYTITNELFNQHPVEWSLFWINYINKEAQKVGKTIQTTEMFQESNITTGYHRVSLENPVMFNFFEASQNAGNSDQEHWNKLESVHTYLSDSPRPINHNKIYGGDEVWWTGGDEQAIRRFWRNIIGGAASARFHRPPAGMGLSPKVQTQIRSARMLLSEFDIFKANPDVNSSKLENRDPDEAYLSFNSGQQYAIYFPQKGTVKLDLQDINTSFKLKWLDINSSSWASTVDIDGGKKMELSTPAGNGSWIALITNKE